jgi:hypothetical protein
MPKKAADDFIKQHRTGVCVTLQFLGYYRAQAGARKAGRPFLRRGGRSIPTPSKLIALLLKTMAKGDYAIQSVGQNAKQGVLLRVLFKEPAEALQFVKEFLPLAEAKSFVRVTEGPCVATINAWVDAEDWKRLVDRLDP